MNDKEIRGLKCFEQVAPNLENGVKDNSVVDISLVETRLYYKKGRKYKAERFNSPEEAAHIVGIKLNDHIIIGDGFTSLKELGYV